MNEETSWPESRSFEPEVIRATEPHAAAGAQAEASDTLRLDVEQPSASTGAGTGTAAGAPSDHVSPTAVMPTDLPAAAVSAATVDEGPSEGQRRHRLVLRRRGEGESAPSGGKRVKKLIGLKIGASQIAAARVINNGKPELMEVVREPLEPGVMVSGEIRDAEALSRALERFFDLHGLPKKGVRLGVSNNRIGVRVFEIEGVTDAGQLENAIRFRAEEVLPIPLEEAILDYVVLEEGEREDGTPVRRILLVVAYREVVERYLEACKGAGLEVVGIDLEAFALLRSLVVPTDSLPGDGALVVVAVGHDRTTIAVSNGRFCEFTRMLDWGGWSLNVPIARALDMAPSEVEGIKRQLSFAEETTIEGLSPARAASAREGLQRALGVFARELVASLQFYQAQPGALGIGQIVLTGGTAHMSGFADAVEGMVGVPVRLGDPFERVKLSKDVALGDQSGSLAVAIGLGIED